MWNISSLLLVSVAGLVQAGIDRNDCVTQSGGAGDTVVCPAGYLAISLCGSGYYASDCGGHCTRLRCCRETTAVSQLGECQSQRKACSPQSSRPGHHLECEADRVVLQVCTSGRNADCGGDAFQSMQCCDDHSQVVTGSCNWVHGRYGNDIECGPNMVVTGICSSGKNADCNWNGATNWVGVKCCTLA